MEMEALVVDGTARLLFACMSKVEKARTQKGFLCAQHQHSSRGGPGGLLQVSSKQLADGAAEVG